jgi:hypothetical protein
MFALLKTAGKAAFSWGAKTFGKAGTKTTAAAGLGGLAVGGTVGYSGGVATGLDLKETLGGWGGLVIIAGTGFALYKILK